MVRFAKAIEEEQPQLLAGIRKIAVQTLPHAESGLHALIQEWGLTLPLEIWYYNRGLIYAPLLKPSSWLEYIICNKPGICFGGFDKRHPALGDFLKAFGKRIVSRTRTISSTSTTRSISTGVSRTVFLEMREGGFAKLPYKSSRWKWFSTFRLLLRFRRPAMLLVVGGTSTC